MPPADQVPDSDLVSDVEAHIAAIQGQTDVALGLLSGKTDGRSVRRRIAVLIDAGNTREAADQARSVSPSREVADLASLALANVGELSSAKVFLDWAINDKNVNSVHRTAVGYIDGAMHWLLRERPVGAAAVPGALTEPETRGLQGILSVVGPLCDALVDHGELRTEVASQLLQRYLDLLYLLGGRETAARVVAVLATREPIPVKVAEAILLGIGRPSSQVVDRLCTEHPESFHAGLAASLVEGRLLGERRAAKQRASSLLELARTNADREQVCELLYELSDADNENDFAEVEAITAGVLGSSSVLLSLFRGDRLFRSGKPHEALRVLQETPADDDPRWLAGVAAARAAVGERTAAIEIYTRVGSIAPTPQVFWALSRLSHEEGRPVDERTALERAVALDPDSLVLRWELATLLTKSRDYVGAGSQFEALRRMDPDDERILANLALSYYLSADLARALSVLVPRQGETRLSTRLLLTRAQVLEAASRADEAFAELSGVEPDHWDEAEYVLVYMRLAYTTGDEANAHRALIRLQELQAAGTIGSQVLRPASLEQLRDWLGQAAKRNEAILRYQLRGSMGWLSAAYLQGEVPLWSWLLRTQPLRWLSDSPLVRPRYTTYSTNGFRVLRQPGVAPKLEAPRSPKAGSKVVVDLTALITLDSLGILDAVLEFFGTAVVPATYLARVADDTRRLLPHQRSQKEASSAIVSAVTTGQISVRVGRHSTADTTSIDEYAEPTPAGSEPVRLSELFGAMHQAGVLSDQEMEQARKVAHAHPDRTADSPRLRVGGRVVIGQLTLVTLHGIGLLGRVTTAFSVAISDSDHRELTSQMVAFEALERVRANHTRLWGQLRSDRRIQFATVRSALVPEASDVGNQDVALDALHLAKETGLPLLADDRVCQAVLLTERADDEFAAFGTDAVVATMNTAGSITTAKAAQLYLQLMEWRYRFLLMPPELIKALLDEYRQHPPGEPLRRLAKYVQESMTDPGLFAGPEATEPPLPVAVRLYQAWARNIGAVVMEVWGDESISDRDAEAFSDWAGTELLPCPPAVLTEAIQAAMATATPPAVLGSALLRVFNHKNIDRMNHGLRALSKALGLREAEYVDLVLRLTRIGDEGERE